MEVIVVREPWVPVWAKPHLSASYTPLILDPQTGLVEETQHVICDCAHCGAHYQTECSTGVARNHIQKFCRTHLGCEAPKEPR